MTFKTKVLDKIPFSVAVIIGLLIMVLILCTVFATEVLWSEREHTVALIYPATPMDSIHAPNCYHGYLSQLDGTTVLDSNFNKQPCSTGSYN